MRRTPRPSRVWWRCALLVSLAVGTPAWPQLAVPSLPSTGIPGTRLPIDVGRTVRDTATTVNRAADLRRLRVRDLLATHREQVERDRDGEPIVRSELVALAPSDTALSAAQAKGYEVIRRQQLDGLDVETVVLRAPRGTSTRRALRDLERLDPDGVYDFNHLYFETAQNDVVLPEAPIVDQRPDIGGDDAPPPSGRSVRIGLIDTGVDALHPVFAADSVHASGCVQPLPDAHGTAVASLVVGAGAHFRGAAPGAHLYAVNVYCDPVTGGAVDALASAFAALAAAEVGVINVSLVGPPNKLLQHVVQRMVARGHLIVAAVGNDGPAAPPRYPAAYDGVVGVTAVDRRDRVLVEAGRGSHVDLAGPGSDMSAAALGGGFATVRGTSFAAPLVAGLLARELPAPSPQGALRALQTVTAQAADLGARGTDKIYGAGLVGASLRTELEQVAAY